MPVAGRTCSQCTMLAKWRWQAVQMRRKREHMPNMVDSGKELTCGAVGGRGGAHRSAAAAVVAAVRREGMAGVARMLLLLLLVPRVPRHRAAEPCGRR